MVAIIYLFIFRYYAGEDLLVLDKNLNESDFEKPGAGKNVSYRIWSLKEKNKPAARSLRVLVRSKTHAVFVGRNPGDETFQVNFKYTLTPSFKTSWAGIAAQW